MSPNGMKSFKEFIVEWSTTDRGVNQYMRRKGYVKLGAGVDQTAWHKPGEDTIIKIFGTQGGSYHSADHMMFKFWAEYCEKHKTNKFLPKFHGWEAFEYNDEKYLQIRMEGLTKLPEDIKYYLQDEFAYNGIQKSKKKREGLYKSNILGHDLNPGNNKLAMLIGEDGFRQLYDTIVEIGIIGREKGWGIDLHGDNFMMRHDGTPVIVDPWVV